MTIIEGNTFLHDWIGVSRMKGDFSDWWIGAIKPEDLIYHKSYEWLMQVVEKVWAITDVSVHISISHNTCSISTFRYLKQTIKSTTIEAVWCGLIEFIQWYERLKSK